jgi:hypothetical protein
MARTAWSITSSEILSMKEWIVLFVASGQWTVGNSTSILLEVRELQPPFHQQRLKIGVDHLDRL